MRMDGAANWFEWENGLLADWWMARTIDLSRCSHGDGKDGKTMHRWWGPTPKNGIHGVIYPGRGLTSQRPVAPVPLLGLSKVAKAPRWKLHSSFVDSKISSCLTIKLISVSTSSVTDMWKIFTVLLSIMHTASTDVNRRFSPYFSP